MKTYPKVIQIIPAPDWWAVYEDEADPIFTRLTCWALVQDDDDNFVTGMDGSDYVEICQDAGNFMGYEYGEITEDVKVQWRNVGIEHRKRQADAQAAREVREARAKVDVH